MYKSISLRYSLEAVYKDVLSISLFVFILSASSKLRVYLPYSPVPITFQTLAVFLSVILLKQKALYSQLAWIGLGVTGFSVFSQGCGFFYLLGPTGGYIIGFLLASLVLVRILFRKDNFFWYVFCFSLAGSIIHLCGMSWLKLITRMSLRETFIAGSLPFIYGDTLKITLASLTARLIKR